MKSQMSHIKKAQAFTWPKNILMFTSWNMKKKKKQKTFK